MGFTPKRKILKRKQAAFKRQAREAILFGVKAFSFLLFRLPIDCRLVCHPRISPLLFRNQSSASWRKFSEGERVHDIYFLSDGEAESWGLNFSSSSSLPYHHHYQGWERGTTKSRKMNCFFFKNWNWKSTRVVIIDRKGRNRRLVIEPIHF